MHDTRPTGATPEFPGRQAAVYLGLALLLALFLVLVLVWRDNGQRATLETTAELTAVGDTHYYPLPAKPPQPPYPAVATFHGQELYPIGYEFYEYQADDMTRLGIDEKGGYIIYQAPPRATAADDPKLGPAYFLKTSPKAYLKIRPNPAAK